MPADRPEVQPAESHVTPPPLPIDTHTTTTTTGPQCYVTLRVKVMAAGGLFPYCDAPV